MSAHGKPTAITPGPWSVDDYGDVQSNGEDLARIASEPLFAAADAGLIAEAGNVFHETGKTPRQLADEVERLTTLADTLAAEDSCLSKLIRRRWGLVAEHDGGWIVVAYSEPDADGVQSEALVGTGSTAAEAITRALAEQQTAGAQP